MPEQEKFVSIQKKPESWKDYPEMVSAHVNPAVSWLAYHGFADLACSLVIKKIYLFPEKEKREVLIQSLKGKQLLYAFSHLGYPDPALALYAMKELRLPNPLMLMADDLGKGLLGKLLRSLGGVDIRREIKVGDTVYKIFEHRGGRAYVSHTKGFVRDKLFAGRDIGYAPSGQRSTNGLLDDSFGDFFGGVVPSAAEEFLIEYGKLLTLLVTNVPAKRFTGEMLSLISRAPLMLITCAITYDFMPDILEQQKRLELGHRISRNELKVDFGFAERDGDGYKTGKLTFAKGVIKRLTSPESRPYGNAYINFAPPVDLGQLVKNTAKRGKNAIANAMLSSMKGAEMLPPTPIFLYSLQQAGGTASRQQLEEIIGSTTSGLLAAEVPLAPTVDINKPWNTMEYAEEILGRNNVAVFAKGSFSTINDFACNYLVNTGKYQFEKLK